MASKELIETARAMVAGDKGLLAMDESNPTCNKRFAEIGIPQTVDYRRAYRELLVTTPGLERFINGAILSDETIRQQTKEKIPFVDILYRSGIIPGIKVDMGTKSLAGFQGETANQMRQDVDDILRESPKRVVAESRFRRAMKAVPGEVGSSTPDKVRFVILLL